MTIKDNVERILESDVDSRGDDKRLIMLYWKLIDGINFSNFESEFIKKSTATESIRRARQLIQEEGRHLPSDEIILKRRMKRDMMKEAIVDTRQVV